ncbi:MAG: hypothetical protein ACI8PZ_003070 [Myxococcota bacterium]|jgi:HEAT repeat protein
MFRAALALVALLPALAWAQPDRAAVMDLLNQHDAAPTQTDFAALGDGVDALLMAIADDTEVPSSRRGRALTALQYYPTDAARAFVEGHLAPESTGLLRRKAVYALAGGWGVSALAPLTAALADHDVQVRIAAVTALAGLESAEATAALTARLEVETVDAVKLALGKVVGK